MIRFIRASINALLVLIVGLTGFVTSTPVAEAAPPVTPNASSARSYTVSLSSIEKRYAELAAQTAVTTKGSLTLNHRNSVTIFYKTKAYAKYHVSWRRQFEYGWILGGGRLSNISSYELGKVYSEGNKYQSREASGYGGAKVNGGTTTNGLPVEIKAPTPCTGRSAAGYHSGDARPWWTYWNSCDTDKVVRNLTWCGGSMGVAAAILAKVKAEAAIFFVVVGGVCGLAATWVQYAKDHSTLEAVLMKQADPFYYNGRWAFPVAMVSQ